MLTEDCDMDVIVYRDTTLDWLLEDVLPLYMSPEEIEKLEDGIAWYEVSEEIGDAANVNHLSHDPDPIRNKVLADKVVCTLRKWVPQIPESKLSEIHKTTAELAV